MQTHITTVKTTAPKIDFYFDEHECSLLNLQWWVGETFDTTTTKAAAELLGDLKDTLKSFRKLKRTYNHKNNTRKGVQRWADTP